MFGTKEVEAPMLKSIRLLRMFSQWDYIDTVAKLQRATVMPLYEFGVTTLAWLLFGKLIIRWINRLIFAITAGEFGAMTDDVGRENNSPYCAEFSEQTVTTDIDEGRSHHSDDLLLADESDGDSEEEDSGGDEARAGRAFRVRRRGRRAASSDAPDDDIDLDDVL